MDLRRRSVLSGLGAVAALGLMPGCATLTYYPRRIGFLTGDQLDVITAFRLELLELGYVEGENIDLVMRSVPAGGDGAAAAAEILETKPEVIVAASQLLALKIRDADPAVPIVIAAGPGNEQFREAARNASRILNGAKPDDFPIAQQPGTT